MSRYQRQTLLPEFGNAGQDAIAKGRVLVVGCGGLGSAAGQYLAAAGVGELTLVDGDRVEDSNLPRQLWFSEGSVGQLKAECAAERLRAMNSRVSVRVFPGYFREENAMSLTREQDLILDCVDDFETKQLLNDLAIQWSIPLVFGSVVGFDGMVGTFLPGQSSCLRCLFPFTSLSSSTSCGLTGVLGPAVGAIGSLQALTAIRVLARSAIDPAIAPNFGSILSMDLRNGTSQMLVVPRRPGCVCCNRKLAIGMGESLREMDWNAIGDIKDIGLIDIREDEEYARGSVPSAKSWPLSLLEAGQSPEFVRSGSHWGIFCARGSRSKRAVELLANFHPDAFFYSIRGGIRAIRDAHE